MSEKGRPFSCENCGSTDLTVTNSRPHGYYIRRRRVCNSCKYRMTFYEVSEGDFKLLRHKSSNQNASAILEGIRVLLDTCK